MGVQALMFQSILYTTYNDPFNIVISNEGLRNDLLTCLEKGSFLAIKRSSDVQEGDLPILLCWWSWTLLRNTKGGKRSESDTLTISRTLDAPQDQTEIIHFMTSTPSQYTWRMFTCDDGIQWSVAPCSCEILSRASLQ